MKDIKIIVDRKTSMVDLDNHMLGNNGENLQGDIIFSFVNDFVDGQARLEYEIQGEKGCLFLTKDKETYKTPIKSVLTKSGAINMQIVITEGVNEEEIPVFKSNVFVVYCNISINAEIEEPEEYVSWIEIANTKLNQLDEGLVKIETRSDYAQAQGDYAKEQGDYAKKKADEILDESVGKKYYVNNVVKGEIFNDYENNIANNFYSHAEGKGTEATGENSHAQNRKAKAYGKHSHAQNYDTLAQGESSSAMGVQTKAYQKGSVAEGNMSEAGVSTIASDVFNPAHAEGEQTKAVGYASHSEGKRTDAIGDYSHSEGEFTQALKEASHAEGRNVIVNNMYAHGEGLDNQALGLASHVEGQYSKAEGEASHCEGSSTITKADFTHSEGIGSKVYDKASHAEGAGTIAGRKTTNTGGGSEGGSSEDDDTEGGIPEGIEGIWASHAEGMNTKAIGKASHSEGTDTQAFSSHSHAEGKNSLAYGEASHAEGGWTQTGELDENGEHRGVTGNYAHAEGFDTRASGQYSHSEGKGTVAKGDCQHVAGRYNTIDNNNMFAVIVGNGTSSSKRGNAYTMDWHGNAYYKGNVRANNGKILATEEFVKNYITALENRVKELEDKLNS